MIILLFLVLFTLLILISSFSHAIDTIFTVRFYLVSIQVFRNVDVGVCVCIGQLVPALVKVFKS